jgi:hypothetical protein
MFDDNDSSRNEIEIIRIINIVSLSPNYGGSWSSKILVFKRFIIRFLLLKIAIYNIYSIQEKNYKNCSDNQFN